MKDIILITSAKGGTGKTAVTAALGAALAGMNEKVLLIDMNFGFRNLDVVTGLENIIFNNAFDAIKKKCALSEAAIMDKNNEGLYILPSPQTKDDSDITADEFKEFIDEIKDDFDYILIDIGGCSKTGINNVIKSVTRAVVITTAEVMSVRNNDKLISKLRHAGLFNVSMVINRLKKDLLDKNDLMSPEDVKEIISADLIGIIPEDDKAYVLINQGKTLKRDECEAAGCINNIAKRIEGEEVPLEDFGSKKGFFERFAGIFKKKDNNLK